MAWTRCNGLLGRARQALAWQGLGMALGLDPAAYGVRESQFLAELWETLGMKDHLDLTNLSGGGGDCPEISDLPASLHAVGQGEGELWGHGGV